MNNRGVSTLNCGSSKIAVWKCLDFRFHVTLWGCSFNWLTPGFYLLKRNDPRTPSRFARTFFSRWFSGQMSQPPPSDSSLCGRFCFVLRIFGGDFFGNFSRWMLEALAGQNGFKFWIVFFNEKICCNSSDPHHGKSIHYTRNSEDACCTSFAV